MSTFFEGVGDLFQEFAGIDEFNPVAKRRVGTIVSLGEGQNKFFFFDTEVPQSLPLGGTQVTALHQFFGGARAADTFGDQPRPLEFSGILLTLEEKQLALTGSAFAQKSLTAQQRMQQLHQFYVDGKELTFQFDLWKFRVVIAEFLPDVKHTNRVDYTIKFHILEDNISKFLPSQKRNQALNISPFVNLAEQIGRAARIAQKLARILSLGIAALAAISQVARKDPSGLIYAGTALLPGGTAVIAMLTTFDNTIATMQNWTTTTQPQTLVDLDTAQPYETLAPEAITSSIIPQLDATIEELETGLGGFANTYSLLSVADPFILSGIYGDGYKYLNLLKLIRFIFASIVSPVSVRVATVVNPDLYKLALKYYRDPTKWTIIADANQITTPKPAGVFRLRIPYEDTANSPGSVSTGV